MLHRVGVAVAVAALVAILTGPGGPVLHPRVVLLHPDDQVAILTGPGGPVLQPGRRM